MQTFLNFLATFVVGILIGCVVGWSVHWSMTRPQPVAIKETLAKDLPGGGKQLASSLNPAAKPAQPLPLGAKPLHVGSAVFKPHPVAAGRKGGKGLLSAKDGATDGASLLPADCPPVEVRYTLYRALDGQEFMRMDSPDGVVLDGRDEIVSTFKPAPERSWGFGVGHGLDGQWGVRVDRDFSFAPVRVGVDLQQAADNRIDPWVWAILRL